MSITMDAREILSHLNKMGYKSVTADQLKEFMRDLKKLIKYDTTANYKELSCLEKNAQFENNFNLLHETTTVSSRAKFLLPSVPPPVPPKSSKVKDVVVRDDNNKENIKPTETKNKVKENNKKTEMEPKTTKMWIRSKYVTKPISKNDPVSLYHSYQRDWERFRHCLPGENDHSELRWAIREKLMSNTNPVTSNRIGKRL